VLFVDREEETADKAVFLFSLCFFSVCGAAYSREKIENLLPQDCDEHHKIFPYVTVATSKHK
jgi:hypothetical protein